MSNPVLREINFLPSNSIDSIRCMLIGLCPLKAPCDVSGLGSPWTNLRIVRNNVPNSSSMINI